MLIITQRMSEPIVEWVGSSCGKHGAYTFYKGFELTANGETRKYLLGEFYFIRNSKDRPICIAEFQLLWHDANTDNKLASARLYFRPESIPGGRQSCHGKDELLYTDEKVVIKCKDMMSLEYDGTGWSYGIKAISELNLQEVPTTGNSDKENTKKFRLLKRKSKTKKMTPKERLKMVILSFPAYCRFKSLMKKLSNGLVLTMMAIKAFGGVIQCSDGTWVSFSRESFHHLGLAKFDMFMHNKAPVLKGRPRKKKVSTTTASKEEIKVKQNNATVEQQTSNEAESSDDNHTDTSEASSIQELPCPPKLVSSIKEEKRSGVIRSVKQDGKPAAIPPVPKLVKIEPKEQIPYGRYTESSLMYTDQISGHQTEKNIPLKMSHSNSVIASSPYRDDGQTNRVSFTTQTRKKCISVDKDCPASLPTSIHASLVSHAATITTNHHIQPRMSTIMSTTLATQGEVTQNLGTSDGNEPRAEQPLKRKRGRPPGKSNKCLKSSEVKIAPKTVEDDQVQMKIEDEYVYTETLMECEEYSPEPQNAEEREFMKNLKIFMRKRGSPIEKIPALGFRKINLFKMYEVTHALGGYDQVTNKRLWRRVYSEVGGAPSITSAATNSRKHYEKLLLPFERFSRGEEYILDVKRSETPSPTPDDLVSPQKDQNGNVVSQNEAIILPTNQQEKLSQLVTVQKIQSKPSIPVLSHVMQPYQQDTRVKAAVTGVMSQQDPRLKAAVTGVMSQQDTRVKTAVTGVMSQQDPRLKAAVTGVMSQQDTRVKAAVTGVMSQQDTRLKAVVTGVMSRQDPRVKAAVTGVMSQQDTRLKAVVTGVMSQQDPRVKAAVTGVMSQQDTRVKAAVTGVMSQQDTRVKTAVTGVMSQQDTRVKAAVTGVMSQQDTRVKTAVTSVMSQQDIRLKTAVTGVMSQPNELFKSAVSRGASLSQQNMSNPSRVIAQEDRHNVSFVTSMKAQNKGSATITSRQDRTSHPLVIHNIEHTHYTKPTSLSYQSQQDRRSVVYSNTQHQYNRAADRDSPVEFITTGSRSSPVLLCSSNADKLSARYPTFDPQGIRHSARPGGFTGTGSSERVSTPDSLRSNKKEDYPVIRMEDYPAIYARQHKTESRMSEFENKPKYLSCFDHVNDFTIPHDYHAEESHDMRKYARGTGDEILLTNVIPGKRAHSPRDIIYSLPVFQPSHYPHGGYELYDLPSTTFPVRASSRIFMPPHQVFPGPGHPAFSPYTPHIIATIGTDPSTLYQLPMPGYYPQELAYPMDTGVQILHS